MITYMGDLPDDQKTGSLAKEKQEISSGGLEAPALKEVGKEGELPPEVTGAGVQMHPTNVPLPQPVQQLGVKQVGTTAVQQPASVTLPLSDDQIAKGLHQSITSSWRWLAEWCMRKLKQIKKIIKK
ncbi:hypothetical protein A3A79_03270 [Candidatus Gottesmanbacteria bacterium RIFCSPLOWO2_01_FULL_43_11b]|uniref:Uncharacterized protein n=1 Tax=Candidatus Gottesmanbacteria bacterium RIFCSPLOWO2_01_FULL_43_11b TaxID=1798392 RepID=A0A1F6AHV8_9BACT|nr:MAG: hypothetical protein A3A79_03270 [Candidatus Gottesmanbacteria bacterium RIFCSPLOWO2_01_FULL_43_11b]